jgi:PAS domain S-box-containing protein
MLITLASGLIPIIIFAVLAQFCGTRFHREMNGTLARLNTEEWVRTEKVLRTMAEDSIRERTAHAVLQIDMHLKAHPQLTLKDLEKKEEFRQMATQPVGRTGNLYLVETETGVIRFHKDRSIENKDLRTLAGEFPLAWSILKPFGKDLPLGGYYDRAGPGGEMAQKYLCSIPLDRRTADGTALSVVASAYVNEFIHPIETVRDIQEDTESALRITINGLLRSFMTMAMVIMAIGVLIALVIARWSGLYFSRTIVALRTATEEVNQGNFAVKVESSVSGEVGDLVRNFNTMVTTLASTTVSKELLEESEYRFRTLAETTSSGILIFRDLLLVYANPAAQRITGISSTTMASLKFWEIAYPDYQQALRDAWNQQLSGGPTPHEGMEIRLLDGEEGEKWAEASVGAMVLDGISAGIITISDVTERKQARSRLSESEERYRVAIENSGDAVAILQGDLHVYVNRRYLEIYGYEGYEEIIGKPSSMVISSQDRDRVGTLNRQRQNGEAAPSRYAFKGLRKDGELIDIEASAVGITYGGLPASLAYLRDITERTRAEEALLTERRKFELLIERAPFGMVIAGKDGRFQYVNPRFTQLFGYSLVDIPDSSAWAQNAFPDDGYRKKAAGLWMKVIESGEMPPETLSVTCRDGSVKMINFQTLELETGDVFTTCEDMTEVVHAHIALREKEEEYRNIIETSLVGIYVIQDGVFKFVNHKFSEMHNVAWEEVVDKADPFYKVHPEDREIVSSQLQKRLTGEMESAEYEFRIVLDGGEMKTLKVLGAVSTYKGRPAIVGTALDISKEKILERQLRESQRLETVGRLAGGIAHDFNNVLNIILGNAQLAKGHIPAEHKVAHYCSSIENAVFRAADFVKQLLAFSRQQLLELKVVDLNETLARFTGMVGRVIGENIDMRVITGPSLPSVKVDVGQIDQILLNLVINARDSMAEGGEIVIETGSRTLNSDYCRFHPESRPGEYVVLSITDTGTGMDQETLGRIFEPFFTKKGVGTGLGLSVVYGIVKQHNGFINVYSEPGKGTTFKIYLPSATEGVRQEEPLSRAVGKGGGETVLVVEDEDPLRNIAAEVLESLGYRVITAANGEEAIDIFRERHGQIDLALIDVVMPRIGGRETYEAMKKIKPALRALFMTGYSLNGIHTNFILEQGIDAIQKPYSFEELADKIREILDR